MRRLIAGAAILAAILPSSVAAQQQDTIPDQRDTIRLREVVVTATRLKTPIGDAPGSVAVISGESMRSSGHRFLADALRQVPGVTLAQSAGPGALTSVFIRGGESDYVQVLIDGVQVNDPGGAFDWAHLRTEDIERVEVVRGAASVLYGSDAVAGVVQIFTRAGGAPRIEAGITGSRGARPGDISTDAYDTRAFDASLSGRAAVSFADGAVLRYGLSGAHAASTGLFAFNSDYDNTNVGARLQLEGTRGDVALTGRALDNEYHYPTNGSGAVVDHNQLATGRTRSFGADAGYRIAGPIELRVLATLHDTEARTDNPADSETDGTFWSTTDQRRRSIDGRVNLDLPRTTVLTVGAEREWQDAQTAFESVNEFGTLAEETDEARTNTGMYVQLHGAPLNSLSVTIGGRIDDNAAFGTFRTGRAALSWRPAAGVRLHASWGTAFKEPTFFENFATGFSRGNPDLEPERARSREAGAEYAFGSGAVLVGATWFDQRFRNLIQYTFTAPSPDAPNFYNVGAARARGVEVSASATLQRLHVGASYTLTDTRVTDDGFGEDMAFQEDRRMLRRPKHQATLDASLQLSTALRALLAARHVGDRDDLDFTDPVQWSGIRTTLDDYTVVDTGVVWSIAGGRGRSLDLSAGVRNVFDTEYQEIYNFPTAGRVFHLGVRAGVGL